MGAEDKRRRSATRSTSPSSSNGRTIGRRRRSSSSSSSKSGKLEGDILPVVPTQFDSVSNEELENVLGLTYALDNSHLFDKDDLDDEDELDSKQEDVRKVSSEKGDFSYFTPNSLIDQQKENNNSMDFDKVVQNAVKAMKGLNLDNENSLPVQKLAEEVSKMDPTKRDHPAEVVFLDIVSELVSNPKEKFNIGSKNAANHNSSKKHSNGVKSSPKSNKNAGIHGQHNTSSNRFAMAGLCPSTFAAVPIPSNHATEQSSETVLKEGSKLSQLNNLKLNAAHKSVDSKAVKAHIANMRNGFAKLKEMLKSDSPQLQLEATKGFRQMISIKKDAVSQDLIKKEIIPLLLEFLKKSSFPALQVEALWALTNLAAASSEQTQLLLKHNAVPILVDLLKSSNREILEQTVWVLGNIAGDDVNARDTVLKAGALPFLLAWMNGCLPQNYWFDPNQAGNQAPPQGTPGYGPVYGNPGFQPLQQPNCQQIDATSQPKGVPHKSGDSTSLAKKSEPSSDAKTQRAKEIDVQPVREQKKRKSQDSGLTEVNSSTNNGLPADAFQQAISGEYPDFSGQPNIDPQLPPNFDPSKVQLSALYPNLQGMTPAQIQQAYSQLQQAQFNQFGHFASSVGQRPLPNHRNFLKIASWTLSNLCDGQPRPDVDITQVLTTVKAILETVDDAEVLSHVCWALSHLCDGSSVYIEHVVRSRICEKLVDLLESKHWRVVKPALRTVGNIVCAEDDQDYTQHIIDCGAIPHLTKLIQSPHKEIQKEACWTISNISAGTVDQIQCVLDSGAIPQLVKLASANIERKQKNSGRLPRKGKQNQSFSKETSSEMSNELREVDADVRIEACWVLLNATSCGNDHQIVQLVREGCVEVLCSLLTDASMVLMALEGIEKVLQVGQEIGRQMYERKKWEREEQRRIRNNKSNQSAHNEPENGVEQSLINPHALLLDTAKIEALQKHRSSAIAKRAKKIWKNHFVECAICKKAYSKHAAMASFCQECKCYVCSHCDCTVFHLSYQDKLWSELMDEENNKTKKQQQNKKDKSKRQKKREKDRKKKLMLKEKEKPNVAQPQLEKEDPEVLVKPEGKERKRSVKDEKVIQKKETQLLEVGEKDKPKKNDKYVDFLLQNGSILDLWNMMNENEDTRSIKSQDSQSQGQGKIVA